MARDRGDADVIPAPFEYERAESVAHAVELLGDRENAKLIAGGHSLLPAMRLRIARPDLLVDVGRLGELRYVREAGDGLAIGALARHHDLVHDPLVGERCPVLAQAASLVGDPQVRHRGTIGGSVAHGDPASDLPTVLLALDAELVAHGPEGERTVPAAAFFRGVFETALGPADVLTEIRVPAATGTYLKFNRRAQDWATVAVAVARADGDVRVGLTNMGPTPLRATEVEAALAAGASPEEAAERADRGTSPPSDTHGTADFRRHLARVLVRRALEQALTG
jgi:carbon-monoxide dehydrogenase medium subunit